MRWSRLQAQPRLRADAQGESQGWRDQQDDLGEPFEQSAFHRNQSPDKQILPFTDERNKFGNCKATFETLTMTTTLVLLLEPCTNVDKVGDVKDRVCVLLDDMSDSCGTLCKVRRSTIMDNDQGVELRSILEFAKAADMLKEAGAKRVIGKSSATIPL